VTFVNDMIDAVVQALAETGRADRTYVLFTSDTGLLMGQHRGRGKDSYANAERLFGFDMRADPYQLTNLRRSALPADLEAFERRAQAYSTCEGASCP
jgi:arylsulfatase A-like enzyme